MRIGMRDIIVILPGITGSVLQKDGKDVWALSGEAISSFLRSFGASLKKLRIVGRDDPELDDLDDGVVASRLIPDAHIIPGFWKVDGYGELCRFLRAEFDVQDGKNFFEFPYDWRRDNRVAARKLGQLVAAKLPTWRAQSGNANAKVILIAHSMGGLICRHYLEVMEGWTTCRALITFGTPYRGAVKALNFVANGYRIVGIDLSEMLRSCTSVFQLLPTYPVVIQEDGRLVKPTELRNCDSFDVSRAIEARKFHDAIESAVERHSNIEKHRTDFALWPVVGCDQHTLQSARLNGSEVLASSALPATVDPLMDYGDGTVPLVSAVPLEMSGQFLMPFHSELHASLQNNPRVLSSLKNWLRQSQVEGLSHLKMVEPTNGEEDRRSAIRLSVSDIYPLEDPVSIRVEIEGPLEPEKVSATIYRVDRESRPLQRDLIRHESGWILEERTLCEGCYRLKIRAINRDPEGQAMLVTDIFHVVSPFEL